MSFVVCFSGVEGSPEFFKPFYSYGEVKTGLSDFFLSAFAGREEDSSLRAFFAPENFEKLLRSSLTAKKLTENENSMRIILDPYSERPFYVEKCEHNTDVDANSVRIRITLLERGIPLSKVEITCVKKRFKQLQKSLKE